MDEINEELLEQATEDLTRTVLQPTDPHHVQLFLLFNIGTQLLRAQNDLIEEREAVRKGATIAHHRAGVLASLQHKLANETEERKRMQVERDRYLQALMKIEKIKSRSKAVTIARRVLRRFEGSFDVGTGNREDLCDIITN